MIKTLAFLLLVVVNLIHCQYHEVMILEKLEDISDKLKGHEKLLNRIPDMQEKLEHLDNGLKDLQQKFGNLETDFQEVSRESGQCLRGDDLEHLTKASTAAHQEIQSFREEMSAFISWVNKDECSEASHPCGSKGICNDAMFGFTCSCPPGFTWDGLDCADIDECIEGKADCSTNQASCQNTLGSYSCSCSPPFEGDGRNCSCPAGFALNGDICEDIDECAEGKAECSKYGICENSIGSYSCSCDAGPDAPGLTSCVLLCKRYPSKIVKGLGCVELEKGPFTFSEALEHCQQGGRQLLQKFHVHHITELPKPNYYGGWVGIYDEKWMSDESPVSKDLWKKRYRSDPSKRCGILWYDSDSSSLKVTQYNCSRTNFAFCQLPMP